MLNIKKRMIKGSLLYAMAGISEFEIPGQKSLVIYISDCQNNCHNCHTSYLKRPFGTLLVDNFMDLFNLYYNYFDVVCFMGEGKNTKKEHQEFNYYCKIIKSRKKKVALYCGRNCTLEKWMYSFDYIKIGSYEEDKGPLTSINTNQKLYKKDAGKFLDITKAFWS